MTHKEFTKLASEHPEDVGGMSHFNCLYQMRVALISQSHKELKSFKPPKKLSGAILTSLCDNFDLLNEMIRKDPTVSSAVLAILLESIGRLDLNALANEPTKPLNKLEEMFALLLLLLLLESISSHEFEEKNGGDTATTGSKDNSSVLSKSDQEKVFATAVELALTGGSASRLLHVIDTLMQCTAKQSDLSFPLPHTLLTLAQRISVTSLLPPKEALMAHEYTIDGFDKINKNNNKDKEKEQNGVGCVVSSGKYLFAHGVFGLMQIGTGYHGSERGKVYQHNPDFYPGEHGSLILLLDPTMTLLFRSKAILPKPFAVLDMSTLKVCGV